MTALDAPPKRTSLPLTTPRLPHWASGLVGLLALCASGLLALLAGWGIAAFVVLAALLYLVGLPLWSLSIEGRRGATDRLMTSLVWTTFGVAVVPLVWLLWTVVDNGLPEINGSFLTFDMRNVIGDQQGGIYHAHHRHPARHASQRRSSPCRSACSARSTWSSTARGIGWRGGSPSSST